MMITLLPLLLQAAAPSPEPTIELRARVRADRLEVRRAEGVRVELRAEPGFALEGGDRGGLPRPLAPGVYEDIGVSLHLRATVAEEGAAPATAEADPE